MVGLKRSINDLIVLAVSDVSIHRKQIDARTAFMLTIPLYTTSSANYNLFQSLCAIQMWRWGANDKVSKTFLTSSYVSG